MPQQAATVGAGYLGARMPKILFVEDDPALAKSIKDVLEFHHFTVDHIDNGGAALEYILSDAYDLVILDRQLPGMSGTELCQAYRKKGGGTPILMLTGLDSLSHKVEGFDSGADDYVTKPFQIQELVARIQALLRRPAAFVSEKITIGDVVIDAKSRQVFAGSTEIRLKPLEYQVLEYFMRHPNQVISPNELLSRVWSTDAEASTDSVYTCINRIRKKLAKGSEDFIQTVHGVGYRVLSK